MSNRRATALISTAVFCRAESRRDQEEGGELDSQEEIRLICESRPDQEEGGDAGPLESPEEIKSRDVELGSQSWTCLLRQLVLDSSATDTVPVTLLRIAVETAIT